MVNFAKNSDRKQPETSKKEVNYFVKKGKKGGLYE